MKVIEKLEFTEVGYEVIKPSDLELSLKINELIDVVNELIKYGPGITR